MKRRRKAFGCYESDASTQAGVKNAYVYYQGLLYAHTQLPEIIQELIGPFLIFELCDNWLLSRYMMTSMT